MIACEATVDYTCVKQNYAAQRFQTTNSEVKLPSPEKASLGINVIWLPDRSLFIHFSDHVIIVKRNTFLKP